MENKPVSDPGLSAFHTWSKEKPLHEMNPEQIWEAAWKEAVHSMQARLDEADIKMQELEDKCDMGYAFDQGMEAARKGIHEVYASENCQLASEIDDPAKPLLKTQYFQDDGDASVGIMAVSGWELAEDQSGTILEGMAKLYSVLWDDYTDESTVWISIDGEVLAETDVTQRVINTLGWKKIVFKSTFLGLDH